MKLLSTRCDGFVSHTSARFGSKIGWLPRSQDHPEKRPRVTLMLVRVAQELAPIQMEWSLPQRLAHSPQSVIGTPALLHDCAL